MHTIRLLAVAGALGLSLCLQLHGAADAPARVEVSLRQIAEHAAPIGVNDFGDMGGTQFSAGNLIPDSGFEPISIRRYWRVTAAGMEDGHPWVDLDGGGVSDHELVTTGYLNGANYRLYRMVDADGDALPLRDGYIDMDLADRYALIDSGQIPTAGTPSLPFGGWVDTVYTVVGQVSGTRTNLDFTDARWVENGRTYHYIVTAIGSNTAGTDGVNESDPATAVEVSATPQVALAAGPYLYSPSGDTFNEITTEAVAGGWFNFRPEIVGATGSVTWTLLDADGQPFTLPAGLGFDATTGEFGGTPEVTPPPTHLRWRATAVNGTVTRDFILNQPAWTPTGGTTRPQPPTNLIATAGDGFVHLSWDASATPDVVGYMIRRAEVPRVEQRRRVYLAAAGAPAAVGDYFYVDYRGTAFDPMLSHPRIRTGLIEETWRPGWGVEGISFQRVPHPGTVPPEMRFPGETCLEVTITAPGTTQISGPYIFFPNNGNPESEYYSQLEPGQTYRYEAWMRHNGLGNDGRVTLGFNSFYAPLGQEVTVDGEWRLVGFTFTAPERSTSEDWHSSPEISFTGPGTLWMDKIRLFRIDDPAQATADFVPSPLVFDELMGSQPAEGEKGMLRSMYVLLNQASMPSKLSHHGDAGLTMDWFQVINRGNNMTLPFMLEYALRTGDSPETRMKPWLNIPAHASEEDWLMLMEFLAAPIDPNDAADVAAKPWAHLRYQQRGVTTPWTDEFVRIYVEFANETWHNRAVNREWTGWGPWYGVHQGAREFGLAARYITEYVRDHSPWWQSAHDAGQLVWVMGSNYDNYGEVARPSVPLAGAIAHTTYVGPRWEVGDQPFAAYDDHGIQATLLAFLTDALPVYRSYRQFREELAAAGHWTEMLGYEGGPSGYALQGTSTPEQVEIGENYGKSQAMAVAALDAWLSAHEYGFTDQGFLSFQQGPRWSSHATIPHGFNPHIPWLALEIRNRHARGRMIDARVTAAPAIVWDGETRPLVSAYAFRDGNRLAVFVLSRKLAGLHDGVDFGDGTTPVTLTLPADPAGSATLYRIAGDPRATNRFAMNVDVEESTVTLSRETTVTLAEGAIHLYVVDTSLPDRDDPPPPPATPTVAHASGHTSLTWTAVPGATGYRVYRSRSAFFDRHTENASFAAATTNFVDPDAVGGSTYYYRVAAVNGWGTGNTTLVAVGGLNPDTPPLAAPEMDALGATTGGLFVSWAAVPGADRYELGYATQSGGPYTWIDVGPSQAWLLSGLENDTPYFVSLFARGTAGRSPDADERTGTPLAAGAVTVLAAWDAAELTYTGTDPVPVVSLPPSNRLLPVEAGAIQRGAGYQLVMDTHGFDAGDYDGTFFLMPDNEYRNFGAAPNGSLADALAHDRYISATVAPAPGQALSFTAFDTGFRYVFVAQDLQAALRYRVGGGSWIDHAGGPQVVASARWEPTDLTYSLAGDSALQDVREPVEFRVYLFADSPDATYHPATLVRNAGDDLFVQGTVTTVAAPGTPTDLRAGTVPGGVVVSWRPVAGATSYTVSWSATPGGPVIGTRPNLTASVTTITGLPGGVPFYFTVQSENGFGASVASTSLSATADGVARTFFGNFGDGTVGNFGLMVRADNSAVFLARVNGGEGWFDSGEFTVADNGSFSFPVWEDTDTISGQIAGDNVTGTLAGSALPFSGTADDPNGATGAFAGFHHHVITPSTDGQLLVIAGPAGHAFALAVENGGGSASSLDFASDGVLASMLINGEQVHLTLNATTGRSTGTYLADSTTRNVWGWREDVAVTREFGNSSIRAQVRAGEGVMIAGFVIAGTGTKQLLIRGVGPTLGEEPFNVPDVLADPRLEVYRQSDPSGSPPMWTNDNWADAPNLTELTQVASDVFAFDLPTDSRDAAALLALPVGGYTAHLRGNASGIGAALTELYDADDALALPTTARLINISLRGETGTGADVVIAGFIITGDAPKRVLIRAVGPELLPYGVQNALSDPALRLYRSVAGSSVEIAFNDDWSERAALIAAVGDQVGAFPLDAGSSSAALLLWLEPGAYTAHGFSADGTRGVALVEVYDGP